MTTFLFKTEPSEYGYGDLVREKRCVWTGVSNPAARIVLRQMRKGDRVLIYHTGEEKAIVAEAKAASNAYEDPSQRGLNDRGEIACPVVDLVPVRAWDDLITLSAIKGDARFKDFVLVKQSRLSVMIVPEAIEHAIDTFKKAPAQTKRRG